MISSEIGNEDELGSVSHMLSADGLAFYNVGYTHAEWINRMDKQDLNSCYRVS